MKKLIGLLLIAFILVGCTSNADKKEEPSTTNQVVKLKVGASITPHAEILKEASAALKEKGVELEIVEFTDYVLPNLGVDDKSLDANYFQHQPYLDNFNKEHGINLVSAGLVHYEPFGIYAGKTKALADLPEGGSIAVPNDATNEARALNLLASNGIIKLKDGAGLNAIKLDIVENPKKLNIVELEAAQLASALADVDLAVINGNYAIQEGLKVADALVVEDAKSLGAQTYANLIAVRAGDENLPAIKTLVEVLQSDAIAQFIEKTYQGSVVVIQ